LPQPQEQPVKKFSIAVLCLAVVIAAVMAFRAGTVFTDRQIAPAGGIGDINLDPDAAVQRFATALTFPTISHDDRSRFDAAAFIALRDYLETAYPLVHQHAERTIINGYSLLFRLPGSDPSLEPVLFMSHMDVVPIEESTRPDWTHPPFDGVVEDGIVWGRGSMDDKIGVISLLESMELLLAENVRPERSVYLAFGHDEEVGGDDGAEQIAKYLEQQGIRFDFVLDEGGAVTQGQVDGIDNELAIIGVSEKGYVNLRLRVNAPGGHSSQPPPQTGLGILSRAIVRVEDNPFPTAIEPMMITVNEIGDRMPWTSRLALANLWLLAPLVERHLVSSPVSAAGIRTTTAATMASASPKANILPTRAEAMINFRILPGETVETVKQRVIDLIDDERVVVSDEYGSNPSPVSPIDTRGYRIIASTIRGTDEDILVAPYMVRGGTDATNFYRVSDNVYRFLMVRINDDTMRYVHGIDERVPVGDYLQAIRFYYHVMRRAMQE
jgi:carboxypeptidase PM20D1